ncbi:MAG: aminotransferase class V-fold PLP-dependent enzyme [Burkholderiales bacterium]|jgi:aspartate aminotransferase-like enzyme|nr:aminotransferase class V-fold PLP-dependent enzyme [Burkholderiales bacterium]
MVNSSKEQWTIKLASEQWEIEQIHRLNYRTFVEEIPQHDDHGDGRLIDRFHEENTYVIALRDRQLIGMMALRGKRPFSLDEKLRDIDSYLPWHTKPVEIRLLAVTQENRRSSLFVKLMGFAMNHCLEEGYDIALISGTTRQLALYRRLGFVPFGDLVGTSKAAFQPMYLTLNAYRKTLREQLAVRRIVAQNLITENERNFLPGPVTVMPEVRRAFETPPMSHRGIAFSDNMKQTRHLLCALTGAEHVQILLGSGTLANEMVAAQLSLSPSSGVVLSNGEFGERLIANARRARLAFTPLSVGWGEHFDLDAVARIVRALPTSGWLWMVHHETSTGMVNPLEKIADCCASSGVRLCVDCVSSLGVMPVDLRRVHLATGVSSKGLGAYPGLSLVFHHDVPKPQPERLAGYLDLGWWAERQSTPYTHSSNLLAALLQAARLVTPERMTRIRDHTLWLHRALTQNGLPPLVAEQDTGAVMTIPFSMPDASMQIGEELEIYGYWLNYRSEYLRNRNWLQISLLGDPQRAQLESLLEALRRACARRELGEARQVPVEMTSAAIV